VIVLNPSSEVIEERRNSSRLTASAAAATSNEIPTEKSSASVTIRQSATRPDKRKCDCYKTRSKTRELQSFTVVLRYYCSW